jgi:hypothetical protein
MDEFQSNSFKSKDKTVEKVVTGNAKQRKKSEISKFADVFISEDAGNVKSYILLDVLIPAIKKAIYDVVTNGIDMILFGGSGHKKNSNSASKVSYRSYYDSQDNRKEQSRYESGKRGFDYDDIIFESRGDAETVLDAMQEIVSSYGVVSVGDFYDLANISTTNFTVNKYGWTSIPGDVKPIRVRDGYILKLPKALPLN